MWRAAFLVSVSQAEAAVDENNEGRKSEDLIYLEIGPSVGLRWPRISSREEVRNS